MYGEFAFLPHILLSELLARFSTVQVILIVYMGVLKYILHKNYAPPPSRNKSVSKFGKAKARKQCTCKKLVSKDAAFRC